MKKSFVTLAAFFTLLFCSANVQAQTINIEIQPSWGPVGYDYAEFYYIPELNVYYDVANGLYYYYASRRWIGAPYLPVRYKRYDLHSMYKVVLNGDPHPWLSNRYHRRDYRHFINDRTQTPIRHTTDPRYEAPRRNTQPWVNNQPKRQPRGIPAVAPRGRENSAPRGEVSPRREENSAPRSNESPRREESAPRGEAPRR